MCFNFDNIFHMITYLGRKMEYTGKLYQKLKMENRKMVKYAWIGRSQKLCGGS